MRSPRWFTALVGLALSLLVSAAAWVYWDSLVLFLLVPFVPLLLGRDRGSADQATVLTCPVCGYQSEDPDRPYCPRDGTRLER